jgi:hypothetical protein
MNQYDSALESIHKTIVWVSEQIEVLKKSQPLTKEQMNIRKNLETKLAWEKKQLSKYE